MLTIFGASKRDTSFCDGITRRNFLTIGGTLLGGGLSLPNLLAAEAQNGIRHSHKAVINIYLAGGPPHLDMWDLKPDAPAEIRGEFKPIDTKISGIQICEHFPRIAAMMDKFVAIRSVVGAGSDAHGAYQCMTGRGRPNDTTGYWPSMGACVSKIQGHVSPATPPHLTLMYDVTTNWGNPGDGGFLGKGYAPFRVVGHKDQGYKEAGPSGKRPDSMVLKNITLERLQDRMALHKALDGLERGLDCTGTMDGMDTFMQQAAGILTSSRLRDALDLSKEEPQVVARYGKDDPFYVNGGAPRMVSNFCIARRLVEAGARVVTLNFSQWDWHGEHKLNQNFVQGRIDMPLLDQAVAALVTDLHERGLDRDVSVVVWGEFGRSPAIGGPIGGGRGHWPYVSCALLAGGGMNLGQVIGATDRRGAYAKDRPVDFQEVFATLYHNLGIDPETTTITDPTGRPQHLVDKPAIRELVG